MSAWPASLCLFVDFLVFTVIWVALAWFTSVVWTNLEIPDPAQFGKASSQNKNLPKKKDKERQELEADQEVAAINRHQEEEPVNFVNLSPEDLPQNNNNMMSTARQPKTVAHLRNKYGNEQDPHFETSADRRRNFLASSSRSSYDTDPKTSDWTSSRYSTKDRSSSPLTRSGSSGGDYYTRSSVADHHRRPSSESSYSRRSPSSYSPTSPSRRLERSDSASKYSTSGIDPHHTRMGTESGYNSLERDKNKRTGTGKTTSSSSRTGDIDSINYIRDQYLGSKTTNGVGHTPATRTHSDYHQTHSSTPTSSSRRLTHQNSIPSESDSEDPETRKARIARYKEQRRKELAQKYGLGSSMIPGAEENDYASRRYKHRQSSLISDGEESDRSVRSVDERLDRYRKYSRDSDTSASRRGESSVSSSRLGSEKDSRHARVGRTSPAAQRQLSRNRSLTEPIQLDQVPRVRRDRSESSSAVPSEKRLARKDSVISEETQQLIANLEASRAARRERLRKSESEGRDDADKIIAKHRARYGSDSDREVFSTSPSRRRASESFDDTPSPRSSTQASPLTRSASERRKRLSSSDESKTKAVMPESRKSRSSEGSESGDTSDQTHKSSRSRRNRRMNVQVSVEELKEAHKLQGTKSPIDESASEDVFFSAKETTPPVISETIPVPIPVIPEETTQTNGMGVDTLNQANSKSSKPTAKVEPVKQESRVAGRSRRHEVLPTDATKHSLTKQHERPKSPVKAVQVSSRRPSSPTKDPRRPLSPTKDVRPGSPVKDARRPTSLAKDTRRPPSPTKDIRRPLSPTKDVRRPTSPTKDARMRPISPTKDVRRPLSPTKDFKRPSSPAKTVSDRTATSKTQSHHRPEIPQVLKKNRAGSVSSESNSSATSEGKRSPSRHVGSKDSVDSRSSPTGSPKKQGYKEPSARLLELSKPRKATTSDVNKNSTTSKPSEKKTPFGTTTPKKQQPKMRLSKEAERRLKATQNTDPTPSTISTTETRKPEKTDVTPVKTVTEITKPDEKTSSEEELEKVVSSQYEVQPEIKPEVVAVEEQIPNRLKEQDSQVEKVKAKVQKTKNVNDLSLDISSVSAPSLQKSQEKDKPLKSPEPEEAKKEALSKKDSDLLAVMKARAEKIDKEYEENEKEKLAKIFKKESSESEDETEDVSVSLDLSPSLSVPVTHRLRAFQVPPGSKPPKSAKDEDLPDGVSPTSKSPPMSPSTSPIRSPPVSPNKSPVGSPSRAARRSQDGPSPVDMTPIDTEEDEEDPLLKLSVSEKMRMFTHLHKQRVKEQAAIKPRPRQFRRVRDSDRSQTQPVTPEELSQASTIAKEMAEKAKSASKEKLSETKLQEIIEEEKEDELSKMSLSEKMKLFHQKSETKVEKPPPKVVVPRRKKRGESRYKTQPVTIEEVKKAAKFSPLARSMAAQPDPRILATMPIADQISLVFGDSSEDNVPKKKVVISQKSPLTRTDSDPNLDKKSILKQSSIEKSSSSSVSILKSETRDSHSMHSIMKSKEVNKVATNVGIKAERVRGILKESQSSTESDDMPGILRRDASPDSLRDPDSILKKDMHAEKQNAAAPGILRKDSTEGKVPAFDKRQRGILRKEDSADADVDSGTDEMQRRRKDASAMSSSDRSRLRREKAGINLVDQSESESDQEPRVRARSSLISPKDSDIVAAKAAANKRKSARFNGSSADRDRYKTQPVSSSTKSPPPGKKAGAAAGASPQHLKTPVSRRQTQPVTPEEMASVKQLMEPVKTTSSIKERLLALKKNGEEDWKNRIRKYEDSPTSGPNDIIQAMNNNNRHGGTPSSISDRLKLLQTNAENSWKCRVEEKDVTQFTVEGKMTKAGIEVTTSAETPVSAMKRSGSFKSRQRGGSFRKRVNLKEDKKEEKLEDNSKGYDSPPSLKLEGFTTTTTESSTDTSESEPDFKVITKKIAIMKPDDDKFSEFFSSSSATSVSKLVKHSKSSTSTKDVFEMSVSDFDAITEITKPRLQALSTHRRSLRPQRRVRPSTNPMKALKSHQAVLEAYTEMKMEMTEVETKTQPKKENSLTKYALSNAAKKGLASKEDLKQGMSKLVKPKDIRQMKNLGNMLPYSDLMLIQVKGRRFVQVRLVEPRVKSLNSGDCFILITPTQLFLWIGEYANVIEKSKASDIAKHIQTKRDLGCKANSIIEVEEPRGETVPSRNWKKFMKVLETEEQYTAVGGPDEDEMHEIYITDTNMVYKMEGDSLVPYDDYWGAPPKYEMLNTKEIIVFDFGSELYIWNGKQTGKEDRKLAVKLAQVVWERGYDYSEYDVNPVFPENKNPESFLAEERPEWSLFCRANQHMETILFSSKFIDWPDESRIIKTKKSQDGQDKENKNEPAPELVAFDAKLMIQPSLERPHLVLEGTNLGRGTGLDEVPNNSNGSNGTIAHFDKIERRGNHISTLSVVVWHILEYEHSIMPNECFGQFHEGDTYVVRWQYRVESTGMRDLKGNLSKRGIGHGRERCAYFFWQGAKSSINEKGASALMTVELDDERGPQRQVIQSKEPAAFLHLFQGRMIQHVGKREEEETNTKGQFRLYCVRGEHLEEAFLQEIPCAMNQLRSRTSFVLLDLKNVETDLNCASVCVWNGSKSSAVTRAVALHCANQIVKHAPMEAGLKPGCNVTLSEMEEGKENRVFRQALGQNRKVYDSAIGDPLDYSYTPRLFHLSSASGMFIANEVLNTYRSEENVVPYPFLQSDLYNVHQPAQFLFDNHYEVYLWQGWWSPEDNEMEGTQKTGSARRRWDIERKCAMETVMAYCNEIGAKSLKGNNPPKAYLVHAGLEPLTFVNLFPYWHHREDVAELNKQDGKEEDHAVLVKDVLQRLTKARYSFEELQDRPLPDGVDPLKMESYLEDNEFETVLKMNRVEFYELPNWKQIDLKKRASLF